MGLVAGVQGGVTRGWRGVLWARGRLRAWAGRVAARWAGQARVQPQAQAQAQAAPGGSAGGAGGDASAQQQQSEPPLPPRQLAVRQHQRLPVFAPRPQWAAAH